MNRKKLQRAALFFCVMAIVAFFIYTVQTHVDQVRAVKGAQRQRETDNVAAQQQREADNEAAQQKATHDAAVSAQQAAQQVAAEHGEFVAQYVDTNFTRTPGLPLVAVAVADENNTMNRAMSTALINRFKGEHAELVDSFFKPPLVSDGLFDDAFNGSAALFAKLEIMNSVDALLLARQAVQYSTNTDLDNVITANMRLEIVTLPVAGHVESQGWTFTANGTGFHPADARMQAEERIIKQITDKTNMTLGLIDSNH